MSDRAFRLDFLIAIAALLMSVLTAGTMVYQTAVMHDQYAATIWPYLTADSTYSEDDVTLKLVNDGFGPAIIRSAQLVVDGKPASGWDSYVGTVLSEAKAAKVLRRGDHASISTSSVDGSSIVRPGESMPLIRFAFPGAEAIVLKHHITLDFCYCSLNNSCWKFHATPGVVSGSYPQPISGCSTGPKIDAPAKLFRATSSAPKR